MIESLDIVIPTTLGNPELLLQCLQSVVTSKQAPQSVTIIVSINTTQEIFTHFKQKFQKQIDQLEKNVPIQWLIHQKNLGFAEAMNKGISAGQAPYVISLNDDAELTENALSTLLKTAQQTRAAMVASKIYLADRKTIDSEGFTFAWRGKAETLQKVGTTWQAKLLSATDYWQKAPTSFPPQLASSFWQEPFGADAAGCLYTRQLLEELKGFKTNFFAYLEDVDLALRARRKGYFCAYASNAIIYHHKHATSSKWKKFKSQQDLINWWRIVLSEYPFSIWKKYCGRILLERLRNLSGWLK